MIFLKDITFGQAIKFSVSFQFFPYMFCFIKARTRDILFPDAGKETESVKDIRVSEHG